MLNDLMIMTNAERLIAKLIDDQKVTGEEAITLIKSLKEGNLIATYPNSTPYITYNSDDSAIHYTTTNKI